MELCRRVIRQNLTKDRIAEGKIDSLVLPKSIKEYLEYKDRRPVAAAAANAQQAKAATVAHAQQDAVNCGRIRREGYAE